MNRQEFKNIIQSIPPKVATHEAGEREMRNVELFFICKEIAKLPRVSLIFESGVWNGRSTAILSAFAKTIGAQVVSCCSKKNPMVERVDSYFDNLTIIYGKGEKHISKFKPDVVISDGPKANSPAGVKLLETAARNNTVQITFQHDVNKEPDGTNFRRVAKTYGKEWGMIPNEFLEKHKSLDGYRYNQLLGYFR